MDSILSDMSHLQFNRLKGLVGAGRIAASREISLIVAKRNQ